MLGNRQNPNSELTEITLLVIKHQRALFGMVCAVGELCCAVFGNIYGEMHENTSYWLLPFINSCCKKNYELALERYPKFRFLNMH